MWRVLRALLLQPAPGVLAMGFPLLLVLLHCPEESKALSKQML